MTTGKPVDVLVLNPCQFDAREVFKQRVVASVHRFLDRAPAEIRNRQEDRTWDIGADSNLTLISVILATALEAIGASYKIWDMDKLLEVAGDRVAEDLRNKPRIIAISSSHFTAEQQLADFVHFVRRHAAHAPIIVGGQLLRAYPELYTTVPEVDYFVYGDGEEVFPRLVQSILRHGGPVPVDLPGVMYRDNGRYAGTREWRAVDINEVPIPRWDLVLTRDFNNFAPRDAPLLPMVFFEETRGCMYRCSFCAYPQEIGHRLKSPQRVTSEIRQYVDWGLRHYNFYSAVFTSPPNHCRQILKWLIESDLGITFSCQARINDLDRNPDLVDLLAKAGCVHMSVGIESADPALLQRMHKPMDLGRTAEVLEKVQRTGITVCPNFFIGFPGETPETIKATYEFVRRGNYPTLYLSSFVVEKMAEVYRHREQYGLQVSADGLSWRHSTMSSADAEDATARFFIQLARDRSLRTVLWVVQWRLVRFFPQLLTQGSDPAVWQALRLFQLGVANEIELLLDGGGERRFAVEQERLWHQLLSYRTFAIGVG